MTKKRRHAVPRPVASPRSGAPGTDPRRRRRRRLGWFLLAVFVAAGVGLALYPYPPVPTAEVETARRALQQARSEAGALAPDPLRSAATSSAVMERLYAYDRSRWPRFKRLEGLDRAILEVRSYSAQAIADAEAVRADRRKVGGEEYRRLTAELAALHPQVKFLPPKERGARGAYARAELALAEAGNALRQGDLTQLDRSLATAQAEVSSTRDTLDARYQRFNDPQWRKRWQSWADATVAASRGGKVAIVVHKLDRRVYLFRDGRLAAKFDADLGRNALADKVAAGDGATPEGRYHVTEKRANGATRWYKALLINYPNDEDMKDFQAMRKRGEIPRGRGPGGLIEIHGQGGKDANWTDGCVAVHNAAMDRLFAAVPVGTPVTIVGTAKLSGVGA